MAQCLQFMPASRITAAAALQHHLFENYPVEESSPPQPYNSKSSTPTPTSLLATSTICSPSEEQAQPQQQSKQHQQPEIFSTPIPLVDFLFENNHTADELRVKFKSYYHFQMISNHHQFLSYLHAFY